ncbi:PEP-CTERM sorting domain-containing protein [Planctellipticum variicoloris]|uniref:PEP-CTERM sorting domain-containing protein n=1 Tax=Planctellipticum variicoloris TaxID=3064265 RepID=UPI003013DC20|nr:PEP-CTERM sorting domain-containing protein [Planctomycetaceae bacterium SH412]
MQKFLMALTTAAFLSTGASAQAALIMGSIGFNSGAVSPLPTGANLTTFESFQFNMSSKEVDGMGDFAVYNVDPMDPLAPSTSETFLNVIVDVANLSGFQFTSADFGSFVASSGIQTVNDGAFRGFVFTGAFTPSGTGLLAGKETTEANVSVIFLQAGQTGTLNAAVTLQAPPTVRTDAVTPEPASIAMFGTMLVPLALGAFRRRQKAAQAAL